MHFPAFPSHAGKREVGLLHRIPLPGKHWESEKVIKSLRTAEEIVKMSTCDPHLPGAVRIVTEGRPVDMETGQWVFCASYRHLN